MSETVRKEVENIWKENTQEPLPVNKNRVILAFAQALQAKEDEIERLKKLTIGDTDSFKIAKMNIELQSELSALRQEKETLKFDLNKPPKERGYCQGCSFPGDFEALRKEARLMWAALRETRHAKVLNNCPITKKIKEDSK